MSTSVRNSPAQQVDFIDAARPFSNFDFVDKYFGGINPLRRILSQARKAGVKTLVWERIIRSQDVVEEDNELRAVQPNYSRSALHRLSFFSTDCNSPAMLRKASDENFLGYAVIKEEPSKSPLEGKFRIYESLFKPSRKENNFIRGAPHWECSIQRIPFRISGFLYAQQNKVTNCCAHVAIRTVSAKFRPGREFHCHEMNQLLRIDQTSKRGGDGLVPEEMERLLKHCGAGVQLIDYSQSQIVPFQKYVYGSIESGYPAIVIFRASQSPHAIPIFGHTFNEDSWVPNASSSYFAVGGNTRYLPSESWLSMFIGHDDNFGSNFCIPRNFLRTSDEVRDAAEPGPRIVESVLITFPKKVKYNSVRAEVIGADYLLSLLGTFPEVNVPWADRLKAHFEAQRLIFRPILITKGEYVGHLKSLQDWGYDKINPRIISALDSFSNEIFWMIELSVSELFSANLRKVGEVLLRAEVVVTAKRDLSSFFIARLPGFFALLSPNSKPDDPQYSFFDSGMPGHVQLFGCERP